MKSSVFISGRHTVCAEPECTYKGGLEIVREHWDGIAKCLVGEEKCPACDCRMLYTRRPMPQEREAAAAWAHMQVIFRAPLLVVAEAAPAELDYEVTWP